MATFIVPGVEGKRSSHRPYTHALVGTRLHESTKEVVLAWSMSEANARKALASWRFPHHSLRVVAVVAV